MIRFSDISKRFSRYQALDSIDLQLGAGRAIALIGPNGSGKTTLIKCLLGMVVPDIGSITFRDKDIRNDHTYRADIGYMPQIGRYPDNMTIGQLIDMMKDIRQSANPSIQRPDARPLDEELIKDLGLQQLFHKRMRSLSGGTRQKVSACLAFLFDPQVLVLDEPTAGLDPVSSGILKEKIDTETAKGKLVLITSHILSELDDLVDEVVYLQEGRVRFHKTIPQLQADTGEKKLVRAIAQIMI
ncbi:MAG TPA: ABC transporter ATP-binding protein [Puia sp.]|uniref:ABC transporter ATP-binding protein n=1 Tax=Puia sp. TaxID=2045100 RepID=UPI002BD9DD03|nr:ABC transporter ATP-binding protein [Puia sp.]HVU94190.1 ABC transporter ATP-binding protein [Puia sp.]